MGRHILYARYSPEGLAGVHKDSYSSRIDINKRMVESVGGSLESLYYMQGGEFNFFIIADLPSDDVIFAMLARARATGLYERVEARRLLTAEEADRALGTEYEWTAPGEATS